MTEPARKLRFKSSDIACAIAFLAYSSSAIMTPICLIELMKELDFSFTGGGVIEAVRDLLLFVVLIACGFAAARWGKPRVMMWGSFILSAGMLSYAVAPGYGMVLVSMVLVGAGGGVVEGLVNPIVQEAHEGDSGRYLNFVNAFWSVGVLVSVLAAGVLLTRNVSWRALVAGSSILGAISGFIFTRLAGRSARVDASDTRELRSRTAKDSWADIRKIIRAPRFWLFAVAMFFGAGAEGAFTFWSATYIRTYYGAVPITGGIGTAIFAAGMIAGRMLSGRYVDQHRLTRLILISAFTGIGVSLLVYVVGGIAGFFLVLFCAGLSVACFWPSIQSYAADCLTVDTTMLFILLSCGGIPGIGFASWIMGLIADNAGIRMSFTVIPVFLSILAAIILIDHNGNRNQI